jgi:hypothetical protein
VFAAARGRAGNLDTPLSFELLQILRASEDVRSAQVIQL